MVDARVVPFAGRPRNLLLDNGVVELIVTLDVGPIVLRYGFAGHPNLLGVLPEPEVDGWRPRGGHRLWVAPEDPAVTWVADDGPVGWSATERGATFTAPVDGAGIEKRLVIALGPGSEVRVEHHLRNAGPGPRRLAAWALSVAAPGAVAHVPLPPPGTHPGREGRTPADYAPRTRMSLWPYFRFGDPRWALAERSLRLRHDPEATTPTKLGLSFPGGTVGVWSEGTWFLKRVPWAPEAEYPDGGVNLELYTDPSILEVETLSPLCTLGPGESLAHTEAWSLVRDPRGAELPADAG